ncbi:MAG: hypothetical protein M3Y50_03495 [Acidobacteriota bacterium]|nr:hypothetical protein [Acidobacteriota bacterium]
MLAAGMRERVIVKMIIENNGSAAENENARGGPLFAHRASSVNEADTSQGVAYQSYCERLRRSQQSKLTSISHGRDLVALVCYEKTMIWETSADRLDQHKT